MAKFNFNLLTHSPERLNVISTRLGASDAVADHFTDAEVGKAVKLGDNTHVLCEAGDEIEAFVDNIDSGGTIDGYSFGGVARGNRGVRMKAVIGQGQVDPAVVGDLVVADAQSALGTKTPAAVKTGTPTINKWRILSLRGSGAAGTEVILELC